MAEEFRLDVTVDEKIAAKPAHQRQAWTSERHVKLDLERWRRQHQRTNARGVIVNPGRRNHRPDTLRHHGDVLLVDLMRCADVIAKRLHIPRTDRKSTRLNSSH